MSFYDQVIIVTGASSGIGASVAIKFATEGANVTIVGRNESKLKDVAKICEQQGSKAFIVTADVTKDSDIHKIVKNTIDQFGKIDILVNNAGMGGGTSMLAHDSMAMFDKIMNTNFRSAVYLTNLVAPHLVETKGNIVNISSVSSTSVVTPVSGAYCASKAALDHFSRCVALELAPKGVRVNCVNPGPVKTSIIENMGADPKLHAKIYESFSSSTAIGRISEPGEIADLVLFLASKKATSITGASYAIDNGALLKGTWNYEGLEL